MAISKELFGQMPDKTEVYKYTLTNRHGVSAAFITLGAVWVSMLVPGRDGQMADVVLGYDDLDSYLKNPPHFGAPIGRNANRIGGAVITIGGKDYPLEPITAPITFTAVRISTTAACGTAGRLRRPGGAAWTFRWKARTGTRDTREMPGSR